MALLIAACLLTYAFLIAVPLVRGVPPWAAVYLVSMVLAGLSMLLVYAGATWPLPIGAEVGLTAGSVAAWIIALQVAQLSELAGFYAGQAARVCFLLACLFLGKLLSRIVREKSIILPVCIVAAIADIYTVFQGPTREALEKAPGLVEKLSLAVPKAGSAAGPEGLRALTNVATIGVGDFIFLALFLSLAARFGLPIARSLLGILGGTLVGIAVALSHPFGLSAMPMLPFMAVGFIGANIGQFEMSPTEKRDVLIAVAIVFLMLVAAAFALHY